MENNKDNCGICRQPHVFGGTDFIHDFKFCSKCLHKIFGRLIIDKLEDIAHDLNFFGEFQTIIEEYKKRFKDSLKK